VVHIKQWNLVSLPLNQPATVTAVTNQSKEMLDDLAEKKITIGTRLEVKKRSRFDQSLQVKLRDKHIILTEQLARHLFVKKL
jgi:Fe2+ transport system protein FeoA